MNANKFPSANNQELVFTVAPELNGYLYRCIVTFKNGTVLTSKSAQLTVNTTPTHTFNAQPQDVNVHSGSNATFSVASNGFSDAYCYEWQVSKDGGTIWTKVNTTKYPSAVMATLVFSTTAAMNNYQYRCMVTFIDYSFIISDPAKLTVTN